jgi:hypothetical protein
MMLNKQDDDLLRCGVSFRMALVTLSGCMHGNVQCVGYGSSTASAVQGRASHLQVQLQLQLHGVSGGVIQLLVTALGLCNHWRMFAALIFLITKIQYLYV